MDFATITELRLIDFKTFSDSVLPLGEATVLIGRNSAGKSNALDGLEVLSRLANTSDLADALDGRRSTTAPVRGGSRGLPPHGSESFALGCTVAVADKRYTYEVRIQVEPELRILSESLCGPGQRLQSGQWAADSPLFQSQPVQQQAAWLNVAVYNGQRGGHNPIYQLRDNQTVLSQIPAHISGTNRSNRSVLAGVEAVRAALLGVFHLDPVPHLMRSYVARRDIHLLRTAQNLSAVLHDMAQTSPDAFADLTAMTREIADGTVRDIAFIGTDLDEVMLALVEDDSGSSADRTPARQMSDGLLRFLAVAAALLGGRRLDVRDDAAQPVHDGGEQPAPGGVLIVIEELENGLHPSQAGRVLSLIQRSAAEPGKSILLTTHSPALLDELQGKMNTDVIVCHRDGDGTSGLTRLVDLPGYVGAIAAGGLGEAQTRGDLDPGVSHDGQNLSDFSRLIGLS